MHQLRQVKSVLNKHKKRDSWFLDEYSISPYGGCSNNCLYCYIRGSNYGYNMNDGLVVKENALIVAQKQLAARARKKEYGIVSLGSATDAYMQHEESYKLTRGLLELLLINKFPVSISTKSLLIKRDIDLLKEIASTAILPEDLNGKLNSGVILSVSISSLDEKVACMLEPGAATPGERLALIKYLREEGFTAGVNAMPLLPFISDTDEKLEEIIIAAKENNADYILTGGLTLFGNGPADSKTLFYRFIERYDTSLLEKYNQIFGNAEYPSWQYQRQLSNKAAYFCKKHHIRNSILHRCQNN